MKIKLLVLLMAAMVTAMSGFVVNPTPVKAATIITNCAGLQDIANNLAGDYELGNNIDCASVLDFVPLGTFTGKLEGAGYSIENLSITGGNNSTGLFNVLDGARVYRLGLIDSEIITNFIGGTLAASAINNTRIVNVGVEGSITSTALQSVIGGIVGQLDDSTLYYGRANVEVDGYTIMGGLVGANENGAGIYNSYSEGTILGRDGGTESIIGGLVGLNGSGEIYDSYSRVDIDATDSVVGGLVGSNTGGSYIQYTYASGLVESDSLVEVGGLVGREAGVAVTADSYWDTQTSGQAASDGGTGKTTVQMQDEATYVDWDFDDFWDIDLAQYPHLFSYNDAPPVITEVTSIPSRVQAAYARYEFSLQGYDQLDLVITPCGGNSSPLAEQLDLSGAPIGIEFTGLENGGTYTCEFYVQNMTEDQSNHLTIGPFTVESGSTSGSRIKKRNIPELPAIPNQQTPALNLDQIVSTPTLGINSLLTRNLYYGLTGSDVKALQQYLNNNGFKLAETGAGSPGNETEVFGPLTRAAVIQFQKARGISPAVGYVGPITRRVIQGG